VDFTASSLYGATPQAPSYGVAAPTANMGTDDITSGWRGLIDPNNPLMWFGVVLLVTVGAAGVAGSVRLGRARASVSLDQA
jgi:hypothetical protein